MTILGGCVFIYPNIYYEQEWVKVDEMIEKLDLNESKFKVLDCLISGKSLS